MQLFCIVFLSISVWIVIKRLDKIIHLLALIKNQRDKNGQ